MNTSNVAGFYKLSVDERISVIRSFADLDDADVALLHGEQGLKLESAAKMVENVIGRMEIPFGVAANFKINGKDYFVPMCTEEPSVIAAASHAAAITGVAAVVLVALVAGLPPQTSFMALGVLAFGVISAWINGLIGARRADVPYGPIDMLLAPGAWALLSLAFLHAAHRLVTEPFTWDKTAHRPDTVDLTPLEPAPNDNGLRIEGVSL